MLYEMTPFYPVTVDTDTNTKGVYYVMYMREVSKFGLGNATKPMIKIDQ